MYSVGGLVLKRALGLAIGGIDNGKYLSLARRCSSIAFFGTPRKYISI